MATDKPRFSVTLDEALDQKVLAYQKRLGVSKSKAATDLILRGIRSLGLDHDAAYENLQKKTSSLSDKALQLAFDFDSLDRWSQQALLALTRAELARMSEQSAPFPAAAMSGSTEIRSMDLSRVDSLSELPEQSSNIPT